MRSARPRAHSLPKSPQGAPGLTVPDSPLSWLNAKLRFTPHAVDPQMNLPCWRATTSQYKKESLLTFFTQAQYAHYCNDTLTITQQHE
eukprot:505572-Amphidinium_carterae.6